MEQDIYYNAYVAEKMLSDKLKRITSKIRKKHIFTLDIALDLIDEYDDVAVQAIDALEVGRAYKIRFGRLYQVKLFVGNRDYYIIIPEVNYCGCMSKYTVGMPKRSLCYHLIAFKIMDSLGLIEELFFDESDFRWIIDELKYKKLDMDL